MARRIIPWLFIGLAVTGVRKAIHVATCFALIVSGIQTQALASSVMVIGDASIMLQTLDGGDTWTSRSAGNNQNFQDAQFSDLSSGFAVGDCGPRCGVIVRTGEDVTDADPVLRADAPVQAGEDIADRALQRVVAGVTDVELVGGSERKTERVDGGLADPGQDGVVPAEVEAIGWLPPLLQLARDE